MDERMLGGLFTRNYLPCFLWNSFIPPRFRLDIYGHGPFVRSSAKTLITPVEKFASRGDDQAARFRKCHRGVNFPRDAVTGTSKPPSP